MKRCLLAILGIVGLSANLFLIGCADDQARQQIADTNQRLSQIQQNVGILDTKVTNQKQVDLLNQANDLQTQINQLNGSVSNIEQAQKTNQNDLSQQLQALELRVQALESAVTNNANNSHDRPVTASNPRTSVNNSTSELQAAIKKIQNKQIPEAITDLQRIIAKNPNKWTVASAEYHLAVAYVANTEYQEAIQTANKFISNNPDNKLVPDAMRIIYIAQTQIGNSKAANVIAKKLVKSFPTSDAAKKVAAQLQQ